MTEYITMSLTQKEVDMLIKYREEQKRQEAWAAKKASCTHDFGYVCSGHGEDLYVCGKCGEHELR